MSLLQPISDAGIRLYDAGTRMLDAGVAAGPVVPAYVIPEPGADFASRVFAAFNDKNWRYLAALCVIGAVALARKLLAQKIEALQHGRWAWTLAILAPGLAALVAHLASNQPLGGIVGLFGSFLSGAFVGLAATGAVKGVFEWQKRPTPPPAGGVPDSVVPLTSSDEGARSAAGLAVPSVPAPPPATPPATPPAPPPSPAKPIVTPTTGPKPPPRPPSKLPSK